MSLGPAHYHANVITLLLYLGMKKRVSRPFQVRISGHHNIAFYKCVMPSGKGAVVPAGRLKAVQQKCLKLLTLTLGYEKESKGDKEEEEMKEEHTRECLISFLHVYFRTTLRHCELKQKNTTGAQFIIQHKAA